jgi:hypothetical protein
MFFKVDWVGGCGSDTASHYLTIPELNRIIPQTEHKNLGVYFAADKIDF